MRRAIDALSPVPEDEAEGGSDSEVAEEAGVMRGTARPLEADVVNQATPNGKRHDGDGLMLQNGSSSSSSSDNCQGVGLDKEQEVTAAPGEAAELTLEQMALVRGMALVWRARAEKRRKGMDRHRSGHLHKPSSHNSPRAGKGQTPKRSPPLRRHGHVRSGSDVPPLTTEDKAEGGEAVCPTDKKQRRRKAAPVGVAVVTSSAAGCHLHDTGGSRDGSVVLNGQADDSDEELQEDEFEDHEGGDEEEFVATMDQVASPPAVTVTIEEQLLDRGYSVHGAKLYCKGNLVMGQVLGEGFFGKAFLATTTSGEQVVVKEFKQEQNDPDAQRRFMEEMDFHRTLFHPNIVEFKGVFWHDNLLNLVTEYIPGGSLLHRIQMPDYLETTTLLQRINMALDISCAMEYLHDQGIIHRDLKSDNCLLRADGSVAVMDFGLSRKLLNHKAYQAACEFKSRYNDVLSELRLKKDTFDPSEAVLVTDCDPATVFKGMRAENDVSRSCYAYSGHIGTAMYMAPEMFSDEPSYNELIDVFSFGLICAEIATGCEADPEPASGRGLPRIIAKMQGHTAFGLSMIEFNKMFSTVCPLLVRLLIGRCCALQARERPTFKQCCSALRTIRAETEALDDGDEEEESDVEPVII